MAESNREILRRRKDRLLATILSYKDNYLDEYLPDDLASEARGFLLDEINDFYHYASSFVDESYIHNEAFLERFDKMFDMVQEMSDG